MCWTAIAINSFLQIAYDIADYMIFSDKSATVLIVQNTHGVYQIISEPLQKQKHNQRICLSWQFNRART